MDEFVSHRAIGEDHVHVGEMLSLQALSQPTHFPARGSMVTGHEQEAACACIAYQSI